MKTKNILIIIFLTAAIIYPQAERTIIKSTDFEASSYIEIKSSKSVFELKQEILSLSEQFSVNPVPTIAPAAKWNPNVFNYISIAWGGFMIYFWTLDGSGLGSTDAEKIVYGVMGAAFIIYGIIGSFDWE